MEPLKLWRSEINAECVAELPELRRPKIDAFLNGILNRNGQLSIESSGGPKSMLFSMQFLIEMSC